MPWYVIKCSECRHEHEANLPVSFVDEAARGKGFAYCPKCERQHAHKKLFVPTTAINPGGGVRPRSEGDEASMWRNKLDLEKKLVTGEVDQVVFPKKRDRRFDPEYKSRYA